MAQSDFYLSIGYLVIVANMLHGVYHQGNSSSHVGHVLLFETHHTILANQTSIAKEP